MAPFKYALKAVGRRYRVVIPAAVGLGALFVSVGPASAHTAMISGSVACGANATQVITWKVGNSQTGAHQDMNIVSATASQGTVGGLPASVAPGAQVSGTTTLPATASGSVNLTVKAFWPYDHFSTTVKSADVKLSNACVPVTTTTIPRTTTTTVPQTTTTTIPDTTTTTAPGTTTTTAPGTTTTTAPTVTTTSVPGQVTTTTVGATVLGENFTKPQPPASTGALAFTGSTVGKLFFAGLAVALMGIVVLGHRARGLLADRD